MDVESGRSVRRGISIVTPVDGLVQSRNHGIRANRTAYAAIWPLGMFVPAGVYLTLEKLGYIEH